LIHIFEGKFKDLCGTVFGVKVYVSKDPSKEDGEKEKWG